MSWWWVVVILLCGRVDWPAAQAFVGQNIAMHASPPARKSFFLMLPALNFISFPILLKHEVRCDTNVEQTSACELLTCASPLFDLGG